MLKFDEYINEGKFVPNLRKIIHRIGVNTDLSKKDDDIAKWIIRRLKKEFDEKYLEHTGDYFTDEDWTYTFINPIKRNSIKRPDIDPYDEEDWGDINLNKLTDLNLMKLMGHSSDSIYRSNRHYYLYIYLSNRESWKQLDVSKENIKTIKKILRQPEKKIEKEKKAREKEAEKIAAKNLRKDIFEY